LSEATVRASIKTLLEGVTNIGLVYDLQPIATTWDVFLDRFKTTISSVNMIRAWTISCEAIERQGQVATGARNTGNINIYQYKIRGYSSFDYETSTEKAFLIVALAVMDALDSGIVSGTVYNADLAQLTSYQPDMLGGALCHVAEITQIVREQI
jgi:ribosomal protein L30E